AAVGATQVARGWHEVADAGIPLYVWGIHAAEMNGQEGIFANWGARCQTCTSRSLPYAGTLVDASRVAVLGYGVSEASKDCVTANADSIEMYADETGQELVYTNDELAFGLPNG